MESPEKNFFGEKLLKKEKKMGIAISG